MLYYQVGVKLTNLQKHAIFGSGIPTFELHTLDNRHRNNIGNNKNGQNIVKHLM